MKGSCHRCDAAICSFCYFRGARIPTTYRGRVMASTRGAGGGRWDLQKLLYCVWVRGLLWWFGTVVNVVKEVSSFLTAVDSWHVISWAPEPRLLGDNSRQVMRPTGWIIGQKHWSDWSIFFSFSNLTQFFISVHFNRAKIFTAIHPIIYMHVCKQNNSTSLTTPVLFYSVLLPLLFIICISGLWPETHFCSCFIFFQ